MKSDIKKFGTGAALSYLSIIINVVSGILFTPWMVSKIGQNQYGIYTLATTFISMLMFDFGLSTAVSRYVADYHARGDEKGVNNVMGMIYKLYLAIDMVILVILSVVYFMIEAIYVKLTPEELQVFKVAYVIVAANSVISFPFIPQSGVLTAYEKFSWLKLTDIIYRIVTIILNIAVLYMGWGLHALIISSAITSMLSIVWRLFLIRSTTQVRANLRYWNKNLLKEVLSISFWVTIYTLAQRLVFSITPTILGAVANSAEIAIFGIVNTIEGYVYMVATAINGLFIHRIARISRGIDGVTDLTPLVTIVGKYQYVVNAVVCVGFICVGKDFITLWMGPDYIDAYIGIVLIVVPGIFYNPMEIAHTAMIFQNKAKKLAIISIITGVTNVVFSLFLSRYYGAIGASIAICSAYFVRNIVAIIVYRRNLHIDFKYFIKEVYVKMLIPTIVCLIAGYAVNFFIDGLTWLGFMLKGGSIVAIMLLCGGTYYLVCHRKNLGVG